MSLSLSLDVDHAISQTGVDALMPGGNQTDLEAAVNTSHQPLLPLSVLLIWPLALPASH
jgi:hypothetical protein